MELMQFSLYFVVIVTNSSYHKLEFSLDNHPDQTQQLQSQLSAFGTEIQQRNQTALFKVLGELVPEHFKDSFCIKNITIIEMAKLTVLKANL